MPLVAGRVGCRVVVCAVVFVGAGCPAADLICSPKTDEEVRRLADYVDVQCDVDISGTDLTVLDGLQGLRSADSVIVGSNVRLTDVELGLSGLERVGALSIVQNPLVRSLVLDNDFDGGLDSLAVSGNDLAVIDVVGVAGGLSISDEPAATVRVGGAPLAQVSLVEVTGLSDLSGIDVETLQALTIRNAPVLLQQDVDAFIAGLDPAPVVVSVCGTALGPAC